MRALHLALALLGAAMPLAPSDALAQDRRDEQFYYPGGFNWHFLDEYPGAARLFVKCRANLEICLADADFIAYFDLCPGAQLTGIQFKRHISAVACGCHFVKVEGGLVVLNGIEQIAGVAGVQLQGCP